MEWIGNFFQTAHKVLLWYSCTMGTWKVENLWGRGAYIQPVPKADKTLQNINTWGDSNKNKYDNSERCKPMPRRQRPMRRIKRSRALSMQAVIQYNSLLWDIWKFFLGGGILTAVVDRQAICWYDQQDHDSFPVDSGGCPPPASTMHHRTEWMLGGWAAEFIYPSVDQKFPHPIFFLGWNWRDKFNQQKSCLTGKLQ